MDIKEEAPRVPIGLSKVGVKGFKVPFYTLVLGRRLHSILSVDAYINLPPTIRGIHASRNLESIIESIVKYGGRLLRVEDFAANVAMDLLIKHPYASRSYVYSYSELVIPMDTPVSGLTSMESIKVYGCALSKRLDGGISTRKFVGLSLFGISACPSARETIAELYELKGIPPEYRPTHMQRLRLKVLIEVGRYALDLMDILRACESSFSAPTFSLLKRADEASLIIEAYKRPMLAEDVAREVACRLAASLSGDEELFIQLESYESIHSHNLVVKARFKARDVLRALGGPSK